MKGGAVGRVVASRAADVPEGALVLTDAAWRDVAVLDARAPSGAARPTRTCRRATTSGVLGMPGLTAYAGLFRVAEFREGDAVFVSGAAGAVGSLVGQFARLRGASAVVGSAGSPEKVRWLTERARLHRRVRLPRRAGRRRCSPRPPRTGSTSSSTTSAASTSRRRSAPCTCTAGRRSAARSPPTTPTEPPPGPRNFSGLMVAKRLALRGFLVGDHTDLRPEFTETVTGWLRSGDLTVRETVREGLEQAVPAFLDLLRGGNTGKMIVRLAPDPD